jgi:hypothetical protein
LSLHSRQICNSENVEEVMPGPDHTPPFPASRETLRSGRKVLKFNRKGRGSNVLIENNLPRYLATIVTVQIQHNGHNWSHWYTKNSSNGTPPNNATTRKCFAETAKSLPSALHKHSKFKSPPAPDTTSYKKSRTKTTFTPA